LNNRTTLVTVLATLLVTTLLPLSSAYAGNAEKASTFKLMKWTPRYFADRSFVIKVLLIFELKWKRRYSKMNLALICDKVMQSLCN